MKIKLENINSSPEGCLDIYFNDYINGVNLDKKVTANLTAKACGADILVNGNINAKVILQCDRCLENYVQDINIEINEKFVKNPIFSTEHGEYELSGGQFVEELGDIEEIDVDELIYQLIVLEIPNKNLCRVDCPGIIEFQDDADKNSDKYIDERLEVFKRFSENNLDNIMETTKRI
ncbi:MAG: DUF177 domain-containing protein [Candidatus Gastranaerophilales bacterium]|nr:DUF177 domain-containing protein [Candidatus Gastranaerophilales bacterium]